MAGIIPETIVTLPSHARRNIALFPPPPSTPGYEARRTKDHAVVEACKIGNFERVIKLCAAAEEGYQLLNQVQDNIGWFPLHYACEHSQHSYVRAMLDHGCNPTRCIDLHGVTPLHVASKYGPVSTVQCLISYGCDPKLCIDNEGCTPLHNACQYGQLQIVKELIKHGCDAEFSMDAEGNSPFYIALQQMEMDIVVELVDGIAGCDIKPYIQQELGVSFFCEACQRGRVDIVALLLWHQFDLQGCMKEQFPLHIACKYGRLEVVRQLIAEGCDPNHSINGEGLSALEVAYKFQQFEVARELVITYQCEDLHSDGLFIEQYRYSHCADNVLWQLQEHNKAANEIQNLVVPSSERSSNTDIHSHERLFSTHTEDQVSLFLLACERGQFDTVRELIEQYDFDPSQSITNDGCTALHVASEYGHAEIVEYLVQTQGCDPTVKTQNSSSPFHYANNPWLAGTAGQQTKQLEVLQALASNFFRKHHGDTINTSTVTNPSLTPSYRSTHCYSRDLQNAQVLLKDSQYPFNPNEQNDDEMSPLHYACRNGLEANVHFLLHQLGCDISCKGKDGNAALHFACWSGNVEIVAFLMDYAPKVCKSKSKNNLKDTPLHFAAISGKKDLVQYLVEKKRANVSSRNKVHDTPLHEACRSGSLDAVQYLTEKKCKLSVKNIHRDTPLHVACCMSGNIEVVKHLIEVKHCKLYQKNRDGDTPFHKACEFGHLDIVDYLVGITAPQNLKTIHNKQGNSPLHTACANGHPEIVRYLVDLDIWHPDTPNKIGQTPLHIACQPHQTPNCSSTHEPLDNQLEIVNLLLSVGDTNPSIKDHSGRTPLMLSDNVEIIKTLLMHRLNKACYSELYIKYNPLFDDPQWLHAKRPPSAVKLFILGDHASGKSTLVKSLQTEDTWFLGRVFNVTGVDAATMGIVPCEFVSKLYGCVTFFDFAGHREYYAGHSAVLQTCVSVLPPVFLLVVNLKESLEQKVKYWLAFIENHCYDLSIHPRLFVIASHYDQLTSAEAARKRTSLSSLLLSNVIDFGGFVEIDCRKAESHELTVVRRWLQQICNEVRIPHELDSLSHYFLQYLKHTYCSNSIAVTVSEIQASVEDSSQWFGLPEEYSEFAPTFSSEDILKLCEELNDHSHILLLKNRNDPPNSWVVTDVNTLLSKVTGAVFTQENMTYDHSTGVVPFSKFEMLFSKLGDSNIDCDMIIQFLCHFEFSQEASDRHLVQLLGSPPSLSGDRLFFFPGLIRADAPNCLWEQNTEYSYRCGWMLVCCSGHFFTTRFLQVLLLRLTFRFAISLCPQETNEITPVLQRKCIMWRNGIFLANRHGVEALVEILDQRVTVMLRCVKDCEIHCVQLRSLIIQCILSAKEEFCTIAHTHESFIHPSELSYPLKPTLSKAVNIDEVAKAISEKARYVLDYSGNQLELEKLLYFDSYAHFSRIILNRLFDVQNSTEKVTDAFLQCAASCVHPVEHLYIQAFTTPLKHVDTPLINLLKPFSDKTYHCLRKKLDGFSVFAGRHSKLVSHAVSMILLI